jgi:hypothetical protein
VTRNHRGEQRLQLGLVVGGVDLGEVGAKRRRSRALDRGGVHEAGIEIAHLLRADANRSGVLGGVIEDRTDLRLRLVDQQQRHAGERTIGAMTVRLSQAPLA